MTQPTALFYLAFFVGGMPALMYQVVWQRVLTLYFGVDIYSTTITVATFMLGLGIGSLVGGRLADRVGSPGATYAGVEVAMGLFGLVSLPLFDAVGRWSAGSPLHVVVLLDFLLLLVPTTLMGTTLPLMGRLVVHADATIGRHLSWLYGVNTMGAAAGALLCSYGLIGWFGLDGTIRIAVALNVGLGVVVFGLVRATAAARAEAREQPSFTVTGAAAASAALRAAVPPAPYRWVLMFSFLSGFIALGYEIVWYRLLTILLHGTVYVFGTILFVFLAGNAAGSLLARRRVDEPGCLERFALCQLGIAAYALVLFTLLGRFSAVAPIRHLTAASFFTSFHPAPELVSGHVDVFSLYSLFDIALWSVALLGLPTVLMGYGFTNLIREGTQHVARLGHSVGAMYFSNILGSTLGSLVVGFVLIDAFGSEGALRVLAIAGATMPLLLRVARRQARGAAPGRGWYESAPARVSAVVTVLVAVAFPAQPAVIKALHFADQPGVEFIGREDRTGVAALRRQHQVIAFAEEAPALGQLRLYIDGAHHGDGIDAVAPDPAVQVALAAHGSPRRVLVIGLGDGQMAATAALASEVTELVVVELNANLDAVLRHTERGRTVLDSAKLSYVVDDGRRWLLAHPDETFDLILMFPLHAAHAFSGSLYSLEFLELLGQRLNDDGILLLQTVDMYSTARTVATVFPHVLRMDGSVYLASHAPIRFDASRLPFAPQEMVRRLTADRPSILAATADARLNRDVAPNSEFYLTYPYRAVLQTRFPNPHVYATTDPRRFHALIMRSPHGKD